MMTGVENVALPIGWTMTEDGAWRRDSSCPLTIGGQSRMEGEREIARLSFAAGRKVVTLQNKGFSPLHKPGGRLFDQCADGRLLMLAPGAWPYLPGKKPITRTDACALNRITQMFCGEGAAEINYRGMLPSGVERLVA